MACFVGGALGGVPTCIPGTETAVAAASSNPWVIPVIFIALVMFFEHEKGKM